MNYDAEQRVKELNKAVDRLTVNCTNCDHFNVRNEQCILAGKVPPIKVAVVGCEQHKRVIPF